MLSVFIRIYSSWIPLDDNGARILLVRNRAYPAKKYSVEELASVISLLQDLLTLEDAYSMFNGILSIVW